MPTADAVRLLERVRRAAASVAPLVRTELMARYRASGIRVRTGKLLSAVSRATIAVSRDLRSLRLALPSGIPPYPGQRSADGFYRVASALNYGCIRQTAGRREKLSADAAREIMRAARRGTAEGFARISSLRARTKTVAARSGGARYIVTRAWKFFRLSRAAKLRIRAALDEALRRGR